MKNLVVMALRQVARVASRVADRMDTRAHVLPGGDDLAADGFEVQAVPDDRPTNPDGAGLDPVATFRSPPPDEPLEGSIQARSQLRW